MSDYTICDLLNHLIYQPWDWADYLFGGSLLMLLGSVGFVVFLPMGVYGDEP